MFAYRAEALHCDAGAGQLYAGVRLGGFGSHSDAKPSSADLVERNAADFAWKAHGRHLSARQQHYPVGKPAGKVQIMGYRNRGKIFGAS